MSENSVIEKLIDKVDSKLDIIQKDLNEFKNGISITVTNLGNKLDVTENKVKNIENFMNRSFKDRVVEMMLTGFIYTFSVLVGISMFLFVLKTLGGNIMNIVKPLFSTLI